MNWLLVTAMLTNSLFTQFSIGNRNKEQRSPFVASREYDFIIVWEEWDKGHPDIFMTIISDNKNTSNRVLVDYYGELLCVGSNPHKYFIIWLDLYDNSTYGALVFSEEESPVKFLISDLSSKKAVISWADSLFVIVYQTEDGKIRASRFDNKGVDIDNEDLYIASGKTSGGIDIAFCDEGGIIVWNQNGIQCARLSKEFKLLGRTGFTSFPLTKKNGWRPKICYGDGVFFLVYSTGDLYGERVRFDGTIIDQPSILLCQDPGYVTANSFNIAFDGEQFLIVFRDDRYGNREGDITLIKFDQQENIEFETISKRKCYEWYPSIDAGRNKSLIVWEQKGGKNWDIFGKFIW